MPSSKDIEQVNFFLNRIVKRNKHLSKIAKRNNTNCYRVYDRDIPEIPLAVDKYDSYLVMYLYERPYEKPENEEREWLSIMAEALESALGIEKSNIIIKTRKRLGIDEQYEKNSYKASKELIVTENSLKFLVKLDQYIDTGLFMDHRLARKMIMEMAENKKVLNLFSYTGSFSVYAMAGHALETTSVDLSKTYLKWTETNIELNNLSNNHKEIHADVNNFLVQAKSKNEKYDLIILDPPTFSNSKRMEGILDTAKQWPILVKKCLDILSTEGTILFSSNARSLKMDESLIPLGNVKDISARTIPEDYRGKIHQSFLITHKN